MQHKQRTQVNSVSMNTTTNTELRSHSTGWNIALPGHSVEMDLPYIRQTLKLVSGLTHEHILAPNDVIQQNSNS